MEIKQERELRTPYYLVDEALLKRIDTQYADGSFREWVRITKHVLKGLQHFGAEKVDDAIVDWALARC